MKIATLFALLTLFISAAEANVPCKVRLSAKLHAAGGKESREQKTQERKRTKTTATTATQVNTTTHTMTLGIELWNYGEEEETVEVMAIFLGADVRPGSKSKIMDSKKSKVTLPPKKQSEMQLSAKDLESAVTTKRTTYESNTSASKRYFPSQSRVESGSRYRGWVVLLYKDGQIVRVEASSDDLKRAAEDEAKLIALYGPIVSE